MTAGEPWRWTPLVGMPDGAETWALPGQGEQEAAWAAHVEALKRDAAKQPVAKVPWHSSGHASRPASLLLSRIWPDMLPRRALPDRRLTALGAARTYATGCKERFVEAWLRERVRGFAIETGQIEGLYTLRRGVAEQLVAEGFAGVVGAHTVEALDDRTIRGLLEDQEAAYDMVFEDVASGRALSEHMVKSWHQLLVRHQNTITGIDLAGRRVEAPFRTKGRWKVQPNNPRRMDGQVHEHCPPEQVQSEMDRFFSLYEEVFERGYPVNAEAAWLHHRFVRTHPFQDGNGRVSRLLMAWAYLKRSLPPPVIAAHAKPAYVNALEMADAGDLKALSDHLGGLALASMIDANQLARQALAGQLERPSGSGLTDVC